MSKTTNIMIVGVGGQGTLLASRILGNAVIRMGYDVKVSEVHGMSQRGGSVVTYVKYGEKVHSPIIDNGEADIVLAFELLEAYRALPVLKADGRLIVNNQRINPMPVITGAAQYPDCIAEKLSNMLWTKPEKMILLYWRVRAMKLIRRSGVSSTIWMSGRKLPPIWQNRRDNVWED